MLHTITLDLPHVLPQNADCDCCANHLVEALRGYAGISAARRDAAALILEIDSQMIADAEVEHVAHVAGRQVAQRYDHPTFDVQGMGCTDCARTLERTLTQLIGVHYAIANFAAAKLHLEYDREQTSIAAISTLAGSLGYDLGSADHRPPTTDHPFDTAQGRRPPTTDQPKTLYGRPSVAADYGLRTTDYVCTVEGMCCAAESVPIERAIQALPGARQVVADPTLARLSVTYDPHALAPAQIIQQIERLGFRVAATADQRLAADQGEGTTGDHQQAATPDGWWSAIAGRPRDLLTALCGLLIGAAWAAELLGGPAILPVVLYVLATLTGGVFVARSGWATLRTTRIFDINALMTIAAGGALVIGEHAEGAVVVFLFALGNALEGYTMERARRSIRALMRLAPVTARVLHDGVEHERPVGTVEVGDTIVVRPGDRIPLDGVVVAGSSAADQSPITGESMPVAKEAGSEVFAGSINGEGALEVQVTRPSQDSTLARIIHLVEQAQTHKSRSQRFIDVFATYYTPTVLILAALVAVLPPLVASGVWAEWVYRALVLLVIACPCALVISTPVSIISAISAAARSGVLFKGGAALEAAGGLKAIAFDKTGTLTTGRPVVTDVVEIENAKLKIENDSRDDQFSILNSQFSILELAAAVERRSAHPLARAIVAAAEERGLAIPVARDFQSLGGRGATATVAGRLAAVGNRAMFASAPLPLQAEARLVELEQAGRTAMLVGYDGVLRGIIAVADGDRAESRAAVSALRRLGIAHIAMLTGDNGRVAAQIAGRIGVDEVRAELLPHEKLAAIDELLAQHGSVGMVGDGVNDAPALARSTVGIGMGAAGSDVALETADVTLMADNLHKLPFAIGLSRSARRVIIQNICFAVAVKVLFLIATLLGVATLWMAVFADTGATVIVIANGMRLLRYRDSRESET